MLNSKIKKQLEYIASLADTCNKNKRIYSEYKEVTNDFLASIEEHLDEIFKVMKPKQVKKFHGYISAYIFCRLGRLVLLNEKLFNRAFEFFGLDNINNQRVYNFFVTDLINELAYRIYNYPKLISCANATIEKFKFTEDDTRLWFNEAIVDYRRLFDNEPIILEDFNNEYDEAKSAPLTNKMKEYYAVIEARMLAEKTAQEEKERKEIEEFKNKSVDFDVNVKVITSKNKYDDCKTNEFSNNVKGFRMVTQFLDAKEHYDKLNGLNNVQLVDKIINQANPFAVLKYIINTIDGDTFDTKLNPNIDYVLDKVKYQTMNHYEGYVGNQNYVNVLSRYFMFYFGISYPKNKEKAEQFLMAHCKSFTFKSEHTWYIKAILPARLLALLYQYHSNVDVFDEYKKFYMDSDFNALTYSYKSAVKYLQLKKETLSNEEVCKLIDSISGHNLLHKSLIEEFDDIYAPYHAEVLRIQNEERLKKEEDERVRLEKLKEYQEKLEAQKERVFNRKKSNDNIKNSTKQVLDIAALKEKTDDPNAMWTVAQHYFYSTDYLGMKYISAYKYYMLAAKLGYKVGYTNAGICYINLYALPQQDDKQHIEKAMEIFKEHSKEEFSCAYYYLISYHITEKPLEIEFAKQLCELYSDESKYNDGKVEIINAAYLLYNKNYLAAIKKYKEIYLSISNINYIETFVTNLYRSFLRKYNTIRENYNKLSKEKESNGIFIDIELARASAALTDSNYAEVKNEILDLIEWACNFECIKVKIDLARYYYNGNYLFAQDKKKAYEILKSLNGNYGDSKEKCDIMFEELSKIYG